MSVQLTDLSTPALADTATWTWVRDRRQPQLAPWFNRQATAGLILVCDVVVLELVRLAPNAQRATAMAETLSAFASVTMPENVWDDARALQLKLAEHGDHRRVPPTDLLIASAALRADVPVLHYDRDYERIASVSALRHQWLVPEGTLA
ncbi:PIN domain-containing protein [Svornostia abyssi]|uniref:Ribonuclease VapC n=1 Tax=Svornostia abyssi TaxID=2898438 RepID=A0ABY5PES8_9ACTN|nr:PIN domain-containing protein [Parviterribacteraceae bacterium J379]